MESSQLGAKISGMEVKLGQKRNSILAQTSEPKNEVKDKSSNVHVTPAKVRVFREVSSAAEHLVCCCKLSEKLINSVMLKYFSFKLTLYSTLQLSIPFKILC